MSETILSRIDDMGSRIEELEKSINELAAQSGDGGAAVATAPSGSSA